VGATAEAVSDLAVGAHFSSGSFAAGRSNRAGIRMYGGWAKIRLIGSGTAAWAIEGLTVTREAGGEFKL